MSYRLVTATNAANATGVSMLDMKMRMTAPAADSAISSGDERRATSAICTPFQPETAMPANADRSRNAHSGQSGALSANAMVEIAEPNEAIISVAGPEATRSAIKPSVTRPNMLLVCITANMSPAVLSDMPRPTTR